MGVAKCGTYDLYRRLRLHPDIMKGVLKEYHWWDRARFGDVYGDDLPIKAEKPKGIVCTESMIMIGLFFSFFFLFSLQY